MKKIAVFDTTISGYNLGNQIIMESVYKQLREIFPNDFFYKLPYMEITRYTIGYIKRSDLIFFGGTNSLTGKMERYKQWGINPLNFWFIKDVILMGVGWWQYQKKTSLYTKIILNHCLSKKYFHAVRDSYTEKKLKEIGFENVLNTGCPTLWELDNQHIKNIKTTKSERAVITFTDYSLNIDRDKKLFKIIADHYKEIYVFLQGAGDFDYVFNTLNLKNIKKIPPNLEAYDNTLFEQDVDYIGTRLHAGIRALQKGRRAIIIGIDNRASEMKKDFNLPVINEHEIDILPDLINSSLELNIKIPIDNIIKWKQQFKEVWFDKRNI
jgi:polysaccharide pyruvyl transferase WcaK-like protein